MVTVLVQMAPIAVCGVVIGRTHRLETTRPENKNAAVPQHCLERVVRVIFLARCLAGIGATYSDRNPIGLWFPIEQHRRPEETTKGCRQNKEGSGTEIN